MLWNPPYLHSIIAEDVSEIIATKLPWEKFKDKTILITGANGFLPAYLVYSFLALNDCKGLSIKRGFNRMTNYFIQGTKIALLFILKVNSISK